MSEIKAWFEEAQKAFNCRDFEFTVVGGFKITHYFEDDTYSIQDTRFTDFYTSVSEADMELFRTEGFVRGANIIMNGRNEARVQKYLELIQGLYVKRAEYKANLKKNPTFYNKRIANCNYNIHNYNDLMHFYKSKVEQFKQNH